MCVQLSAACRVEKYIKRQKDVITDRQLLISDRVNYDCSKVKFSSKMFPKCGIYCPGFWIFG